jgi:branched-chain amino acid transport system ATP-binding protein
MMLLELKDISKSFGGLQALFQINLSIEQGTFNAVIGPNGAGKTTLFNVITRYTVPDCGQLLFQGEDITELSIPEVSRRGIGRSFQIAKIYSDLTVLENIQLALISHQKKNSNVFSSAAKMFHEKAIGLAELVGISSELSLIASTIPHGDKRRLDIGLALAQEPTLLLLDEPASGLSPKERSSIILLLLKLAKERGLTVLLIEHDLDIAFRAEEIFVLHRGELIANGRPEQIKENEHVRKIYLGV